MTCAQKWLVDLAVVGPKHHPGRACLRQTRRRRLAHDHETRSRRTGCSAGAETRPRLNLIRWTAATAVLSTKVSGTALGDLIHVNQRPLLAQDTPHALAVRLSLIGEQRR